MKIKKINYIKEYKSFVDFKWSEFCLDSAGSEKTFCHYNVIFGENGSGKSAICEILKDISKNRPFSDNCDKPNSVQITVDKTLHNFSTGLWNNYLPENSILFFDQSFVDENVHTNGERSNERNKHSQNSGKLLIDLDAEANKKKQAENIASKALKDFEDANTIKLNQLFLPKDLEIYITLKDKSDDEINELRDSNRDNYKSLSDDIDQLKLRKIQTTNVSSYNPPEEITLTTELPSISDISELFSRKIEDSTIKISSEKIVKHITTHKEFIEKGMQIMNSTGNKETCPFCLQSLSTQEEIINSYSNFFNKTYQEQKEKYILDIELIKTKLNNLKEEVNQLLSKITSSYNSLTEFWNNYNVFEFYYEKVQVTKEEQKDAFKDRYSLEKSIGSLTNFPQALDSLLTALENLKIIDHKDYDYKTDYTKVQNHLKGIKETLADVSLSLKKYITSTIEFKTKYSDISIINKEIQQKEPTLIKHSDLKDYFDNNLHQQIKDWNKLKADKEVLKLAFTTAKEELKTYILSQAPKLILSKMMAFLDRFNLSFKLEPNRVAGATSEAPFSFKIIDLNGKERNIKAGLSEGERQLVSLAFFFAINENTADKIDNILIFDDPITSLDAANLKILSDAIFEQVKSYSQVFVLTHHPLFYKYLVKKESPNPNKFGILKNSTAFKGAFIYVDSEFDLYVQLKGCHQALIKKATTGTLSVEEAAISYGHLLRLSLERFIKNELLMWNKEDNFSTLTNGLKDAKSKIKLLSDSDLDIIDKVFKYCNYANFLHADKESSSALNELLQHIDKYITIVDNVRNPKPIIITP